MFHIQKIRKQKNLHPQNLLILQKADINIYFTLKQVFTPKMFNPKNVDQQNILPQFFIVPGKIRTQEYFFSPKNLDLKKILNPSKLSAAKKIWSQEKWCVQFK